MKNGKKQPKILLVDDIAINLELQKAYLQGSGYDVVLAMDGEEALRKVYEEKPDLILLDIMMPKKNGYEVCRLLKNDPETRFIPVIMVTALKDIEDKIKGIEAGADDFISKPFNKTELMARVRSLLRIKFLHDELENKMEQLDEARKELQQLAITDGLTGLFNYRYFRSQLDHELERARRHNLELSLIMTDIDFFKSYNDTNGHPAGDVVLKTIADAVRENIRKIDIPCRYGGEEFILILPDTGKKAAVVVADKIRDLIEKMPFKNQEKQPNGKLTISIGVATFPEDGETSDELVENVDANLYKAKQSGRNKVVAGS
ncbi:MAG: diguanylate cyclase [Calditrichaeota bacterium]|nr:diguanylate cyclase [Calditrichota bacterium]